MVLGPTGRRPPVIGKPPAPISPYCQPTAPPTALA
ncbi:hypothetical protein LINPERHAP1_LOCUS24907 [Linum perenne]